MLRLLSAVSIAQARHPFMQPADGLDRLGDLPEVSIAQARHPFMQPKLGVVLVGSLLCFNRSSATSLYATETYIRQAWASGRFQSLKRDIPLCNFDVIDTG